MRTNPLLRDLMSTFLEISGQQSGMEIDFDELGVAEVVELLDHANMDAVVRDFGDKNPREDPVIHFYESFLFEYDKQKKVERGVFYTPRPVVSYIVRSAHHLLRTEFGLDDGLADVTTWGEMAARHKGVKVPDGISPDQDFVQVLDPATGTGTFLVEAIDLIYHTLVDKWRSLGYHDRQVDALWNEYVPKHLLPRLHGYELLMAPYAIAHLKIGLKLYETGYRFGSETRAQVYLTNALEPARELAGLMNFAIPALAQEARAVNRVKVEQRFTVVIGNPPYSGQSANKGAWMSALLRGQDGEMATGSYFQVDGKSLGERNSKWLNDDYVKFMRYGHRCIERTRVGLLGFVTNHSYLDNPTFRGMRQVLKDTFDAMYLLDLHGNSKKKERSPEGGKDENVFDIQQGVAVCLLLKRAGDSRERTGVFHADLWGERDVGVDGGKYGRLAGSTAASTAWIELAPKSPRYLFIPRDETLADEYEAGRSITEIFPIGSTGIVSKRDRVAYHFDKDSLYRTLEDFATLPDAQLRGRYPFRESRDGKLSLVKAHILSYGIKEKYIRLCLYRPFDTRWTYHTDKSKGFLGWPVYHLMRHMLAGPNVGLIATRQCQRDWSVLATNTIIGHKALATYDISSLFPLYTYPTEGQARVGLARKPNLGKELVEAVGSSLQLEFIADGSGNLHQSFGPEDIFNYIYAVLHSPRYRRRYADFLKSDFARVPFTSDRSLFAKLGVLGRRLASLHLMELRANQSPLFRSGGSNRVDRVRYVPESDDAPGRVFINRDQCFEGIAPQTWAFTIGGYRPAERWLKDRKDRVLSNNDIDYYRRIVAALAATQRLMNEIDELIEQQGGWPQAFNSRRTDQA